MLVQMLFSDVMTQICRSGFGGCHAAKKDDDQWADDSFAALN